MSRPDRSRCWRWKSAARSLLRLTGSGGLAAWVNLRQEARLWLNSVISSAPLILLIPAQRTKGREFPDLVVLAPWKGPYQAKLPIGGRVAVFALGKCTRKG